MSATDSTNAVTILTDAAWTIRLLRSSRMPPASWAAYERHAGLMHAALVRGDLAGVRHQRDEMDRLGGQRQAAVARLGEDEVDEPAWTRSASDNLSDEIVKHLARESASDVGERPR
jgi:hypothetical protein